jgi:hypothetical protein
MAVPLIVQVLQENGASTSFAMLQFYKHMCVWFVCGDNYQFGSATDYYGKDTVHLDPGEWLIKASWMGQQGQARFTLTSSGPGTLQQSGKLIVTVHKA